ncbi:hypothetical protein MLD38_025740 [Melastoma candidum]|uniref:Uncharacterized protein n=1 Tax=Melastoma candidum TaxID=119954 RepID=A0ACB9NXP8_9MYRT|nr:hypothetical protein MLD38_025740 [Melastoma candidum]
MAEEKKQEEAKGEEKVEEKKEGKAEEKKEEVKPEEELPKLLPPLVLRVDLHCVRCVNKIARSLMRIRVRKKRTEEEVQVMGDGWQILLVIGDCNARAVGGVVGVGIDMEKNELSVKGVVEPPAVWDKIAKKTKRTHR